MANGVGKITELRLEANGLSGRITCPPALLPVPGQYLMATSSDPAEPLPTALFPTGIEAGELRVAAPLPGNWMTGMSLALRGPLGSGFRMPATARRVALAALEGSPERLLLLARMALTQGAAVAIYAQVIPAGLPPEVEILPLDLLPEAPAWADFLALDAPLAALPGLRARFGLNPYQALACLTQVLLVSPMPCSGLAECGICAVPTRAGWALACTDGPVFDFTALEGI